MAYTAGDVLVKTKIQSVDSINRDAVVFDLAFQRSDLAAPNFANTDALFTLIMNFLNVTPAGAADPVAAFLSPELSRAANAVEMKAYHIVVGLLGPPYQMRLDSIGIAGGTALPSEVACCLSYNSDLSGLSEELPDTTRPAARHRGRVYIGPLGTNTLSIDGTTHQAFLSAGIRTTLTKAGKVLHDDCILNGWKWAQWSRKRVQLDPVVACHADNAFDTQRRRGPRATARTTETF